MLIRFLRRMGVEGHRLEEDAQAHQLKGHGTPLFMAPLHRQQGNDTG